MISCFHQEPDVCLPRTDHLALHGLGWAGCLLGPAHGLWRVRSLPPVAPGPRFRGRTTSSLPFRLPFLGAIALLAGLLTGCATGDRGRADGPVFQELAPAAAEELLVARAGQSDFVILDVRTPGEFAEERIAGSRNVDFNSRDFRSQVEALDREATYFVYCRTGNRSGQSLGLFRELGFRDVRHLTAGIVGWKSAGLPTVRG